MAQSFDQLLARHCAPALAGIKPANLVSCSKADYPHLPDLLEEQGPKLEERGIRLDVLCQCDRRFLVLVYRPEALKRHLAKRAVAKLLIKAGYDPGAGVDACLHRLRHRMEGQEFPHEVGLFLGYPPEDVAGFCRYCGQKYKYCGHWKVYGDVDQAKALFEQYARCRDSLCRRVGMGLSIVQIFPVV